MILNKKGISLVEIIVVTSILIAIILFLASLTSPIKNIGVSSHESTAKEIASSEIENLRSDGYTNIISATTNLTTLPNGQKIITVANCSVTICPNSEETKEVSVKIVWTESGNNKEIELKTLISNGGLQ